MNLSQQMTLLGLAALAYYGILLATGVVSMDVMPQFVVSAIIFLSSGRFLRQARIRIREKQPEEESERSRREPNWALRTQVLNWVMALLIIGALALWVMKPVGVSFWEMFCWP